MLNSPAISYPQYRWWIDTVVAPHHRYLAFDEPGGDPALNMAYLADMRRRGYNPVPVFHPGMDRGILTESEFALGGLLGIKASERVAYLDGIFYNPDTTRISGRVHLLGITNPWWFERYPAPSGDSTTWVKRCIQDKTHSLEEWLTKYGEHSIPHNPPHRIQRRLAI